ncbi:MAG: hypothetical protein WAU36_01125 [Cyclobacteriaceae bacterium]
MKRKILLIEPDYENKYPPIGLMKISTYHKLLGDRVQFFKGNVNDLVINGRSNDTIKSLKKLDARIKWELHKPDLIKYFKCRKETELRKFINQFRVQLRKPLKKILKEHSSSKPSQQYNRVYVTTLFTFYWRVTVKAIKQAKNLVTDEHDLHVGGVMASLLKGEIKEATGVEPFSGLLDKPGVLDANDLIVDDLPLDYSILEEINYEYPTGSAYITFMTKGCTRKCAFCSVPILEPEYKNKIPTIDKFNGIKESFGEQRHLLLMDNNVLASPRFEEIVDEIIQMGFYKGAKYLQPNLLDITIRNLRSGVNDVGYKRKAIKLLTNFAHKLQGKRKMLVDETLATYNICNNPDVKKSIIYKVYKILGPIYEEKRYKGEVDRYVDFNQGIDARYVNDKNMSLISKININPLRIAFDFIGMREQYINAVTLAHKYHITQLSNYLLYNFKDKPEDLYERLRINVELNKKFGLRIFSFPMKYIPLFGEDAKSRKYIGPNWNKKFIRAIQSILNATKGIVAPGPKYFDMAFGKNLEEFWELLYMPETFIIYRNKFAEAGLTEDWRQKFNSLNDEETRVAKTLIEKCDFTNIMALSINSKVSQVLKYYTINEKALSSVDVSREKLAAKFNKLIEKDLFINLTLTYDFEGSRKDNTDILSIV